MSKNILFVGSFTKDARDLIKTYLNQKYTAYFAEFEEDVDEITQKLDFKFCFTAGYYKNSYGSAFNPCKLLIRLLTQGLEVRFLFSDECPELFSVFEINHFQSQEMDESLVFLKSNFENFEIFNVNLPGFVMLLQGYVDDDLVEELVAPEEENDSVEIQFPAPDNIFFEYGNIVVGRN